MQCFMVSSIKHQFQPNKKPYQVIPVLVSLNISGSMLIDSLIEFINYGDDFFYLEKQYYIVLLYSNLAYI